MSAMAVVSPLTELVRKVQGGQAIVLTGVSWDVYQILLKTLFEEHLHARTTYDRGRFEVMPTSRLHEIIKSLLARMLEAWADALNIPYNFGGEMSCEREDLQCGLQPDECYWIRNAARVSGKTELDFTVDPPPDLVLEVEISHSVLSRFPILAQLGVPEVWRCNGKTLQIGLLQAEGDYLWGETSVNLPGLPIAELNRYLQQIGTLDHAIIIRNFRAWLQNRPAN